jgi:hypothetical protein
MALGIVDRSLVLEFAIVLPPSLSDERRALPVSISLQRVNFSPLVDEGPSSIKTYNSIEHALENIQGTLCPCGLRHSDVNSDTWQIRAE